jgi:hypothetical protein
MSSLAIPPKRVQLYRVLWDRWIIVLRILLDLGAMSHPVKWRAVADTLLVDKKTCQKYINGLVRDGHLAIAGEGVMLTQAGMDILQEHDSRELIPLVVGKNPGEKFSLLEVVVNELDSELSLTTTTPKLGKNPGEKFSPLAKLLIANIPDLFAGSQLSPACLNETSDEVFLGWVAYTYDKRTSFTSPVGMLYSKLLRGERPPVEFMKHFADYLPEAFLEAIGLLKKVCGMCEQVFAQGAAYESHYQACYLAHQQDDVRDEPTISMQVDESVQVGLRDGAGLSAEQGWQSVLDQLKLDMQRGTFDTWVRDTKALHFEQDTLQVGVASNLVRDWLESRLQRTCERLLVGILNREVTVQFVVAAETEVA